MKKYGLIPEDPTYTALFNACANSPFREDGLKRADGLCLLIREKGIEPNFLTIKAMVKTYGKLGEIGTATSIIDRIVEAGQYKLDDEAWSHIFIACISDKETGFKHAIEIWRRMRLKLKPNAYHYNLLLRSARDCSVGDSDYANELLGRSTAEQDAFMENRLPSGFKPRKEIDINSLVVSEYKSLSKDCDIPKGFGGAESKQPVSNPEINASTGQIVKKIQRSETKAMALTQADLPEVSNQLLSLRSDNSSQGVSNVPNILNPRGVRKGAIISLGNLETPESRLSLLGGVPGVLGHMKKDNVNPDIKTFSLFLDMIPSTTKAEHDLLAVMEVGLVEPDEDFLNAIIRRRCKRYEFTSALDVLSLFNKMKLVPNLMTFANLALGCKNHTSGLMLLENIKDAGFEPTVDIYGILIRRSGYNFKYMKALCLRMGRDRIEPNKNIIEVLEAKISKTGKFIVKKEKGENVPKQFLGDEMAKDFKGFMLFYKPWLLSTNVYTPPHPWTQYRNPYSNNNPETQDDDKNQS